MKPYRKALLAMAALSIGLVLGAPSHAQTYPQKTIKIIVTAAPGGPADLPARLAAQVLNTKFGQPVVVEHRPGAGGAIGAREVAQAPADGYTLLLGNTSTLAVIPAVSTSAGYDPVKNFAPVGRIAEGFQVIAVHRSAPWTSLTQFIEYAKANPGKLNWAHSGPGSLPHLAMEVFMMRTATKMTGVSYRSGGESVNALLSRAVHVTSEGIAGVAPQVGQGNLRALAMQNSKRNKVLPDLPTLAELGVPNAEADTFYRPRRAGRHACRHYQDPQCGAERRHHVGGHPAAARECRAGGQAQYTGGVCRLHRHPASAVGGGRQGCGRDDQLILWESPGSLAPADRAYGRTTLCPKQQHRCIP